MQESPLTDVAHTADNNNGAYARNAVVNSNHPDSELLIDLLYALSDKKTIREVACDICKKVLLGFKKRFPNVSIDICALWGFYDWFEISKNLKGILKLKGVAGFQPYDVHDKAIKIGEGIIGRVAQQKRLVSTSDLKHDPRLGNEIEKLLIGLADRVSLVGLPLILADGQLVGVLALGQFGAQEASDNLFLHADFTERIAQLAKHIATIYYHELQVVKASLSKKYITNERGIIKTAMQFYRDTTHEIDPKKFMEIIARESMKLLNTGDPDHPPNHSYYTNYLFYEYQEYRERFVLSSFLKKPKPRYLRRSFSCNHKLYKDYVKDGFVKCVESQKKFVKNRGREPYVVRYVHNKVQEIIEKLDANWSPAGSGSAFIVPLFEEQRPLGILIFTSRHQNRQYVNNPLFYLGSEKRKSGLYDLKYFRSLQPFIAREYFKLKLEDKQSLVAKLENVMSALKEIILIENRHEVLDRLAEFTAKSLDCEGCLIYLLNSSRSHLHAAAAFGFQANAGLKREVAFPRQLPLTQRQSLPAQIFDLNKEILANSDREFERISAQPNLLNPFFKQLKSGKVISYLGRSIGALGVIEVFNKSKSTASRWSFFEEQDSFTLRHISEVIATVLNRMEATKSEKVRVINELLLDISHELKNPLYSSSIFLRKLRSSLNDRTNSEDENGVLQMLDLVERNVEKARRILANMQNFQASATQAKREPVNLEKIIQVVIQTNALFCEQQRITIGSKFSVHDPIVYGDELQLNQVFTNLVMNAIDAMPNGGMLQAQLDEQNGELVAEIADTGDGIPEEIKDHVFDPFVTTKNADSGTGLGLALSLRLIKQHRGMIEFETKAGWGTKFIVTLPRYVDQPFASTQQLLVSQPLPDEEMC